jgi:hypothetical protein
MRISRHQRTARQFVGMGALLFSLASSPAADAAYTAFRPHAFETVLAGNRVVVPLTAMIAAAAGPDQPETRLRIEADLSDLQAKIPALAPGLQPRPGGEPCGDRFTISDLRLQAPAVDGLASLLVVRVAYERWACPEIRSAEIRGVNIAWRSEIAPANRLVP